MSELHDTPAPVPNLPLTMEEAAGKLFRVDYKTLRNRLKSLIAQGLPVVKRGGRYYFYPAHVEAWEISRYPDAARRALRQGGYDVSTTQQSR